MSRILLKNCSVLNEACDALCENSHVLIEDNLIVAVSNDSPTLQPNTTVIDLEGCTVMPGLIDAHIHVASPPSNLLTDPYAETYIGIYAKIQLEKILQRGFTSIRDAGGELYGVAEALNKGLILGPRLFYSGRAISQTGGHGDFRDRSAVFMPCGCCNSGSVVSRIADGITEVRKAVRDELRKGATQIKVMASGGVASPNDSVLDLQYSDEELRAIVEEAKAKQTYVMAHVFSPAGIKRCIEAGIRTIEHAFLLDDTTAKLMADQGVYFVPTLAIIDALDRKGKQFGMSETSLKKLKQIQGVAQKSLAHAKRHQVKTGFGSDVFGELIDEQSNELILRAQLDSNQHVIQSATKINAEILQMSDKLGVVAPGYLADIIVVKGNPLNDINLLAGNGEHIPLVIKNGVVCKNNI